MAAKQKIIDATKRLKELATGASDSVSKSADKLSMELREVRTSIASVGSEQLEQRIDKIFPKTSAPAYVLHHSNASDDYSVHFDLSHVLSLLDSGVLARPSVVLYAGRSDIDREQLSERVSAEFLSEMKNHEARVKAVAIEDARKHRDALDGSISKVLKGATEAAFMHVLLILVSGPIGLYILLEMGSFERTIDAIKELITIPKKLLKAGSESVTQPLADKRVESAISEERAKINKALTTLELKMHKDLIALAGSYDNVAYPFRGDRESDALPEHVTNLIRDYGGEFLPDRI